MAGFEVTAEASSTYYLVQLCDSGTNVQYIVEYNYNSGTPRITVNRQQQNVSNNYVLSSTGALGTSNIHMVTLTYDATTLKGYFDGVSFGTPLACSGNGSGGAHTTLDIGGAVADGNVLMASALIDDLSIFSRSLSATEVRQIYLATSGNAFTKTLSEAFTLAESFIKAAGKNIVENVTIAEVFIWQAGRTFADSISIIESLSQAIIKVAAFLDTFTITEAFTRVVGRVLTESITVSETLLKTAQRALSDALSVVEAFSATKGGALARSFSDAFTVTEIFAKTVGKSLLETFGLAELFQTLKMYFRTVTESVSLSEVFSTLKPNAKSFTDIVAVTDSIKKSVVKKLSELLTVVESFLRKLNGTATIATKRIKPVMSMFKRTKPTTTATKRVKP